VKSIDAVSRAMQVLDVLRDNPTVSLAKLHQETEISKATLLRILKTLQESGWVFRSLNDASYRLSFNIGNLGQQHTDVNPLETLGELAAPIIQQIESKLRWPSDVAVRDGLSMLVVESTRSQAGFVLNRDVMGIRPHFLFSGIGRAYLAFCPEEERREIIAALKAGSSKEAKLARDQVWLKNMLDQTRAQGFGVREPAFYGVRTPAGAQIEAIAVPVFSRDNEASKVVATLSVAWPKGNVGWDIVTDTFYPCLRKAADQLADSI